MNGLRILTFSSLAIAMTVDPMAALGQLDTTGAIRKHAITLARTTENITPDGNLDEPGWQMATEAGDFIQIDPHEGKSATAKTVFKIVCNDKAIYIAVIMYISDPRKLRITALTRDFSYLNNDFVSVLIDGYHDKRNAMVFACNAKGALWDELSFDDQLYDLNWNGLWRVGTKIYRDRWVAEFEIPWKTLRYKSTGQDQTWGFNIFRLNRSNNESSAWAPFPHAYNPTRMDFAGSLDSIDPPPLRTNIQVLPFASYNHLKGKVVDPYRHRVEDGADLKWGISSNTVADLTYQPDFAQAEADLEVNNTTRYNVYYPEKRPFFLENASFFGGGLNINSGGYGGHMEIQAFNSRTIGLDTSGIPITIQGAARLVHRSSRDNYGFIFAHQGDNDLNTAWLGTARYSYNLGSGSRMGLFTNIDDQVSPRRNNVNVVNGADALVRLGKTESISTMIMHSYDSKAAGAGYSWYAQYMHTSDPLLAYVTASYVGTNFDNRLGFTSQSNSYSIAPGFISIIRKINWVPFHHTLLELDPGTLDEFDYTADTHSLTHSEVTVYPFYFVLRSGGNLYLLLGSFYDHLFTPFTPLDLTIAPGRYHYNNAVASYTSDPSRKLVVSGTAGIGNYFNGWLNNYSAAITFVPIPNIAVVGTITDNDFRNVGDKKRDNVSLASFNGSFSVNTKLILSTLIQANTANHSIGYNVRVAWEYRPLSYVYLVFNELKQENSLSKVLPYQQEIIKASFLYQF